MNYHVTITTPAELRLDAAQAERTKDFTSPTSPTVTERNGILYAGNGHMLTMRLPDDDEAIVCTARSIGLLYMEAVARMECPTGLRSAYAQLMALADAGIVRDVMP